MSAAVLKLTAYYTEIFRQNDYAGDTAHQK